MSIKTYSIYDITYFFIKKYNNIKKFAQKDKIKIFKNIITLINKRFTDKEIFKYFRFFNNKYNGYFDIETNFKNIKPTVLNLIHLNRIYYHNELIITGKYSVTNYNNNYTKKDMYYFENICSYTLNDLISYYQTKPIYNKKYCNKYKIINNFKWLINNYNLEIILYMIDIYNSLVNYNIIENSYNPLDICNLYKNAVYNYNNKKNKATIMGIEKIVPRKRTLYN